MIVSIEGIPQDRRFDVCIAGSGPAGMSLALALAEKGKDVLLLEGGSTEFSDRSQDLYIGEITGDPYPELDSARLRFLGGSSNHWAGRWTRSISPTRTIVRRRTGRSTDRISTPISSAPRTSWMSTAISQTKCWLRRFRD